MGYSLFSSYQAVLLSCAEFQEMLVGSKATIGVKVGGTKAVSYGSYNEGYCSMAWVIKGSDSGRAWSGKL